MTKIIKLFSVLLVAEALTAAVIIGSHLPPKAYIADKDEKTAYIITLTGSNADVLEACKNQSTGKIKAFVK